MGASGGAMIIAGTMEVILNHIFKGMDPFSSVMAPRSYHQVRREKISCIIYISVSEYLCSQQILLAAGT